MQTEIDIRKNLVNLLKQIPKNIKLIAVSKTQSIDKIIETYNCGQRVFGENKALDLKEKYNALPKDIEWHFIGHLQSNKVKYIAPFVKLIHSIDSINILLEINKEAKKNNRIIDCLLEFFIAGEETKFGLDLDEAETLLNSDIFKSFENIKIIGVMGMASFTDDDDLIRKEFKKLKNIFDTLKVKYFADKDTFKEISMGMSGDYLIAISEGSTMIRIGTSIFGERNY
jgi:pyridoxal phosphate enzyme (YggS family)